MEIHVQKTAGRPKTRWEDDVLEDIKSINISKWKKVAEDRDIWKKVAEQAQNRIQVVALYKKKKNITKVLKVLAYYA